MEPSPAKKMKMDNHLKTKTYDEVKREFEQDACKICNPLVYLCPAHDELSNLKDFDLYNGPQQLSEHKLREYGEGKYYYSEEKDETTNQNHWVRHKFIDRWLLDENKRQYEGFIVNPKAPISTTHYNLWRPFRASMLPPIPDSDVQRLVQPSIDFITSFLARRDARRADLILEYVCRRIQHPEHRTSIVLQFTGRDEMAKMIFWDFITESVFGGTTATKIHHENRLRSTDTKEFVGKVLVQIDHLGKRHKNLVRTLINDTLVYKDKNSKPFTVQNYANLVLTTDIKVKGVPTDRLLIFECGDTRINDRDYEALKTHFRQPEAARAFYQFAMKKDLSDYMHLLTSAACV